METPVYGVDKLAKYYNADRLSCSTEIRDCEGTPFCSLVHHWNKGLLNVFREKPKGGGGKLADKKTFMLLKCKEIV